MMTKTIATFRAFYCLHIWRRTNGYKWTDKWTGERENMKTGQMDKWDKWRTNGGQMVGQMDKMVDKHRFGENGTNGRAYS
jgi:hypothetical protein